ncbi:MAG: sulfide/dihydroorotate dehydrogenase-like FAD/NAD-binding protein [Candidatus Omnitrophota bacterium]|nr:sulfide/dihydroorotate dehydrogenase-like FAD/NAD-binding protein [Candidatus Omnitrophota bacterium]MBU2528415.1 sulfide/dihydroorotate dehydrogenase-like FAD/NAD-binding protein [bacterium]MBU3930673.1 sulfide/dihydroorotate dehydrogenase-like FAD/NAD-binding protein [bacterium]MBU4123474.1 sulfide/dihydroorotate dehydrogenase-like FAD/NAD-binding protein [bacterium]
MFEIKKKEQLAGDTVLFAVDAPDIAENGRPGQFVMVMVNEEGERIPLTIADFDPASGTITIVFKILGKTTGDLGRLKEGDRIFNIAGPLGKPSETGKTGKIIMVAGGIGIALIHPIAGAMKKSGNNVTSIIGAQNKDMIFWVDKIKDVSSEVIVTTDDGSLGKKGFVTGELKVLLESKEKPGLVFAVGPVVMMKAVADLTRHYKVKTVVSLNPIMVDGTGMCGSCRVEVGGKTMFACVDGPDFDAHEVDFSLLSKRQNVYLELEKEAMGSPHKCKCL